MLHLSRSSLFYVVVNIISKCSHAIIDAYYGQKQCIDDRRICIVGKKECGQ